jgi:hypothetical protein
MTPDDGTTAALARVKEAQTTLREMLRNVRPSRLRERPASGDWSPLEHVRHLIFAEQHHFSPYLERAFRWSSAGVPPPNRTGERRLSRIGSDPVMTVDEVFDAWEKVHRVIRALCIESGGQLNHVLEGNLKHTKVHAAAIASLLREERV